MLLILGDLWAPVVRGGEGLGRCGRGGVRIEERRGNGKLFPVLGIYWERRDFFSWRISRESRMS